MTILLDDAGTPSADEFRALVKDPLLELISIPLIPVALHPSFKYTRLEAKVKEDWRVGYPLKVTETK